MVEKAQIRSRRGQFVEPASSSGGVAVLALGTAVPDRRMDQETIYEQVLAPLLDGNRYARAIFRHAGVGWRHLAVEETYYRRERTTQARNTRYLADALPLGATAIQRCLQSGGWQPRDVDDFIVASCTGIDTPGLDLRLAAQLDMRSDVRRATVLGMGCYAALPSLLRAHEAARGGRRALVLAVELCSLHFQPDDASTQNVVSAALFSDGAAAIFVGPDPMPAQHPARPRPRGNGQKRAMGPRLLDFETLCDYKTFEQMGFHLTDHGFQMRLGARVPDVLAANVNGFVQRLLQRNNLQQTEVDVWAIHPGSAKILDQMETQLALDPRALNPSRAVLHNFGNMSSPTILFVLEEVRRQGQAMPGAYGVLLGFGPGLTLEGALVQW